MKHLRHIRTQELETEAPETYEAILRGFERYGGIFNPRIGRYFNRIANEVRAEGYNITPYRVQALHQMLMKQAKPGIDLLVLLSQISRR
ncbi:MAG: hypothetical protein WHV66_00065 [Anaerolineales bacterium]